MRLRDSIDESPATPLLTAPRIRITELFSEAQSGLAQRPGRSILTALGTVLGVAVLTTVLGLTATTQAQIGERFDALAATEITVNQAQEGIGVASFSAFPNDSEERAKRINGVTSFGLSWEVPKDYSNHVSTLPPWLSGQERPAPAGVLAVSPGEFEVMKSSFSAGRPFNRFDQTSQARVAVLGSAVAQRLGVTDLALHRTVFVDGIAFTVVGVLNDVRRHPSALTQVIVPTETALAVWGPPSPDRPAIAHVEVLPGAAEVVGQQIDVALRPDNKSLLVVSVPPDPKTLRAQVSGDLNSLFLLLAGICLIIGMVGIANTTLVSVLERVPEIGLRRALGARPRHIAAQFLTESTILGVFGGMAGAVVAVVLIVGISAANSWTAVLPPMIALSGPLVGGCTGLLAGLYPSWKASRIEPVEALRR